MAEAGLFSTMATPLLFGDGQTFCQEVAATDTFLHGPLLVLWELIEAEIDDILLANARVRAVARKHNPGQRQIAGHR